MVHPDPDRIVGEPTYETIKALEHQIMANSQVTTTSLRGGHHRYLGLVKSPQAYALVSQVPFTAPESRGLLVIPNGVTAAVAADLRTNHEEAKRVFLEYENIERTLKNQIVSALDSKYTKALTNRTTNAIDSSIPQIFEYLYSTYGSAHFLRKKQRLPMAYDILQPVDLVFHAVEDLLEHPLCSMPSRTSFSWQNMQRFPIRLRSALVLHT